MKHRWIALGALSLAFAGFVAGQVAAQDEMGGGGGFQMPEWTKRTAQHEELGKLAGTWDVVMKMWTAPDAPPMESIGTSTGKSILGGNYIQQDLKSSVMGMPLKVALSRTCDRPMKANGPKKSSPRVKPGNSATVLTLPVSRSTQARLP